MRPLCLGMTSHPYSSSLLFLSQCRSSFLYLNILPAGCLSSLLHPNFYLDLWWARPRLLRGIAMFHVLNPEQDSNHPSSSKNNTGVITNYQYATLPGLQPVHDRDSHKQEIPAKSTHFVTTRNACWNCAYPRSHNSSNSGRNTRCPLYE